MANQDARNFEDVVPLLDIPRPCSVHWSSMSGAGAARSCGQCQRAVHDLSVLSEMQIQALMRDPSKRVCARMDWNTVQRLGTASLKALALSTILTTSGGAMAAQSPDASSSSPVNIRGVVQDGNRPLADIDVRAKRYGGGQEHVTKTNERGAYAFENLVPGLYVISFLRSSRPLSSDVAVEVCKGTTVTLATRPDESSGVIGEVVGISPGSGVIRGAVTAQKLDEGLAGATVTLWRPDDGLRRTTQTDEVGGYRFDGLKPGHYELSGAEKGFMTGSIGFDLKAKPAIQYSAKGPSSIGPGDLDGDIALCPQVTAK